MSETALKIMWTEDFFKLMSSCFGFLAHEWNVFGFNISFLNCMVMVECFYILMNFIAGIFGTQEVEFGGE